MDNGFFEAELDVELEKVPDLLFLFLTRQIFLLAIVVLLLFKPVITVEEVIFVRVVRAILLLGLLRHFTSSEEPIGDEVAFLRGIDSDSLWFFFFYSEGCI